MNVIAAPCSPQWGIFLGRHESLYSLSPGYLAVWHAYVVNGNCDKLIKHSITFSCTAEKEPLSPNVAEYLFYYEDGEGKEWEVGPGCHDKNETIKRRINLSPTITGVEEEEGRL